MRVKCADLKLCGMARVGWVRLPRQLFDGWYFLRTMVCEYDKNIVEYLYQTKDTESHEDSDFCYDLGRKI